MTRANSLLLHMSSNLHVTLC